jgi:hypothetical protein
MSIHRTVVAGLIATLLTIVFGAGTMDLAQQQPAAPAAPPALYNTVK